MENKELEKDLKKLPRWKKRLYIIIFQSDTFKGRLFDEMLLVLILFSVVMVMVESVAGLREQYSGFIYFSEWTLTILFLFEYVLRIICSPRPLKYIFSFFGIVDLLAILPTFLSLIVPGLQPLIVIRAIRLLRVYRILKLTRYIRAGNRLLIALRSSFRKIFIFMIFVLILVLLLGSIMYVVEGGQNGFYSIPLSIYWAVITLTTVGYGDIVPVTNLGKFIATFIMLLGYSIIAIPTGIVSSEITRGRAEKVETHVCDYCGESEHIKGSSFCNNCGHSL
ncbi:MAG: ion transporter [Bacteroidetes bacterium]|nr:MAG: ion transporter [Bacteroidota bacterium]